MRIDVSGEDLAKLKADLAVCFAFEKDKTPRGVRDVRLRRELAAPDGRTRAPETARVIEELFRN